MSVNLYMFNYVFLMENSSGPQILCSLWAIFMNISQSFQWFSIIMFVPQKFFMECANDTYTMENNNICIWHYKCSLKYHFTHFMLVAHQVTFSQLSMHFLKSILFPPLEILYKIIHHKIDELKDHYLCEDGPLFPQSENCLGKT